MSQEEAIKILKEINVVDFYNTYTDSTTDFSEPRKYCDAIETILDLYNKEKETSHFLQSQLDEANAKLIEEKEKNKELERYKKYYQNERNLLDSYISKDKIRTKIKELEDLNSKFSQRVIKSKEIYLTEMVQNILKELLEEM